MENYCSFQFFWCNILLLLVSSMTLKLTTSKLFTANSNYDGRIDWDDFFLTSHYTQLADAFHDTYANAEPFAHIYLDNIFPAHVTDAAALEFPDHKQGEDLLHGWGVWADVTANLKYFLRDEELMGPACVQFINHLRSRMFTIFLERLTGIPYLLSDPYLHGGGLHQIGRGGHLAIHADFNRRETDGLWRRVNVFIYLNDDWDDSFGGHLELWDKNMTRCVQKILPIKNRLVIFSSTSSSMHGHPDPLECPPDRYRKSIAVYYYTKEPAPGHGHNESTPYSTTNFRSRPEGHGWEHEYPPK